MPRKHLAWRIAGKYYDGAGALRDMIQNHLMQLMAFTAMESPSVFDPEPIRDEIVKVFRALRPYKTHDMDNLIVQWPVRRLSGREECGA